MQEEVENRTVNLAISTTKLTGRSLVNAFRAYLNYRRNVKARKASIQDTHIVGEQTIDQLLGQNQGATNIEIEKTEIAGFKRIASQGLSFFVDCMDTAVLLSTVYSASLSLNFSRTNMSILPSRFGPFHLLGFVLSGLLASIPIPHKLSNGLASTSSLFPVCRRV